MNYYDEIKEELVNNEVYKRAKDYSKNKSDLITYYNVGKLIIDAQGGEARAKYGDGLIKEYSKKLMKEVDKKYSYRNLMFMRKFYLLFKDEIVNAVRSQLSWTHFRILFALDDINEIKYYLSVAERDNISYRKLEEKIKSKEYERLDEETKLKLINNEELEIKDLVKNPIVIKNKYDTTKISEKMFHKLILEDIESFMKELGEGFCFI